MILSPKRISTAKTSHKEMLASTVPSASVGRIEACMKAHIADVSDACKVAMANAAAGND
jgi:hypothetical protein